MAQQHFIPSAIPNSKMPKTKRRLSLFQNPVGFGTASPYKITGQAKPPAAMFTNLLSGPVIKKTAAFFMTPMCRFKMSAGARQRMREHVD